MPQTFVRIVCLSRALLPAFLAVFLLSGCGFTVIEIPAWDAGGTGDVSSRVVQTAKSQIGARYRAGGTTPSGFDCSGLIWWAYRQQGINVPRVTSDQANAGSRVSPRSMRAGDILVFNTRQGRTGLHTGLYTGNGRFVHSPSSGRRVREDSIHEEYWNNRLIRVRRVLR